MRALDCEETAACARLERDCLQLFGGGCRAPFGAFARGEGGRFELFVAAFRGGADASRRFSGAGAEALLTLAAAWATGAGEDTGEPITPAWVARPATPWCG